MNMGMSMGMGQYQRQNQRMALIPEPPSPTESGPKTRVDLSSAVVLLEHIFLYKLLDMLTSAIVCMERGCRAEFRLEDQEFKHHADGGFSSLFLHKDFPGLVIHLSRFNKTYSDMRAAAQLSEQGLLSDVYCLPIGVATAGRVQICLFPFLEGFQELPLDSLHTRSAQLKAFCERSANKGALHSDLAPRNIMVRGDEMVIVDAGSLHIYKRTGTKIRNDLFKQMFLSIWGYNTTEMEESECEQKLKDLLS